MKETILRIRFYWRQINIALFIFISLFYFISKEVAVHQMNLLLYLFDFPIYSFFKLITIPYDFGYFTDILFPFLVCFSLCYFLVFYLIEKILLFLDKEFTYYGPVD